MEVRLATLVLLLHLIPTNSLDWNFGNDLDLDYKSLETDDEYPGDLHYVKHKIVNGRNAELGEAPYQLSLMQHGRPKCGATLVKSPTSGNQIAITAAHCVCKKGSNVQQPTEEHNLRGGHINKYAGYRIDVRKIVRHEGYDGSYFHDIAILFLDGQYDVNWKLEPIALPEFMKDESGLKSLNVSGWGRLKEKGETAIELQIVTVPVIDGETCAELYEKYFAKQKVIAETTLCAGYDEGGKDACAGDSGGPAVGEDEHGKKYLAGVVSWGKGCARPGTPGVYMRVSSYIDWITEKTRQYDRTNQKPGEGYGGPY